MGDNDQWNDGVWNQTTGNQMIETNDKSWDTNQSNHSSAMNQRFKSFNPLKGFAGDKDKRIDSNQIFQSNDNERDKINDYGNSSNGNSWGNKDRSFSNNKLGSDYSRNLSKKTIKISTCFVTKLIGPEGSTVRELSSKSGAIIITRTDSRHSYETDVDLIGNNEQIRTAEDLINIIRVDGIVHSNISQFDTISNDLKSQNQLSNENKDFNPKQKDSTGFYKNLVNNNITNSSTTNSATDSSQIQIQDSKQDIDKTSNSNRVFRFLKSKKEKGKKEKKKKNKSDNSSAKEDNGVEPKDSNSTNNEIPVVDDEGYIIRPNLVNQTNKDNNFYSSSDDGSDEEKEPKILVKINPLTNGAPISASVDELIASAGTLSLSPIAQNTNRRIYRSSASPTPEDVPIKRSVSANHSISKTESDLISVFSSSMSSASTPSGVADQNASNSKTINSNSNTVNSVKSPPADRYAAFSDLFSQSSNESNEARNSTVLSKSMSASILGPPLTTSIPRPTSKRNPQTSPQLSHQSSTISRCQSVSSLSSDFRMTPISVGSSRGPSPLTLGISDSVPIAIALQESVSACFKGIDETKCQVQAIGSLKMAFPAGIVQAFANNPYPAPLTFKLNKSSKLEKIYPNKELLIENSESLKSTTNDSLSFEVNMTALLSSIRRLYEQSPNSRYYNIDVLKYQIRCLNGARSAPLQLVSYWKCEPQTTNLKIDYKFNSSTLTQVEPLRNISISVNIDGEPHSMQSRPEGKWNQVTKQSVWRFDQISHITDINGLGSIKAKFDLTSGPSTASVIQAQFTCLDATLSGVDFELTGLGYRVSLVKKQISSGRYICESGI